MLVRYWEEGACVHIFHPVFVDGSLAGRAPFVPCGVRAATYRALQPWSGFRLADRSIFLWNSTAPRVMISRTQSTAGICPTGVCNMASVVAVEAAWWVVCELDSR